MTTFKERLAIAAALMLMAGPGLAQTTSGSTPSTFESLSPGNQKIARALFNAQKPTANGPAPLSLNQIATLKEHEGWGRVFDQMRADGLVQAKNLGQVVSSYEHHLHASGVSGSRHTVTVTNGSGRSYASGHTHEEAAAGDHGATGESGEHGHGGNDGAVTVATAGGAAVNSGPHGMSSDAAGSSNAGGGSHGGGVAHGH